jgi:hypothetical protein
MREPGLLRQPRSFLYFLPLFTNFAVKLPEKCLQQRFECEFGRYKNSDGRKTSTGALLRALHRRSWDFLDSLVVEFSEVHIQFFTSLFVLVGWRAPFPHPST